MRTPAALLLTFLLAACASTSPRYQITVGNDHERQPVRDVRVSADGRELPAFTQIAPQKVAAARPRSGQPPRLISLRWTTPDGREFSKEISTQERIPEDFRGQLVLSIAPDGTVGLTPVESKGPKLSAIPWGAPEQWEGSVFLPGMNP